MCFLHWLVPNCYQELSPLQTHAVSGNECAYHSYYCFCKGSQRLIRWFSCLMYSCTHHTCYSETITSSSTGKHLHIPVTSGSKATGGKQLEESESHAMLNALAVQASLMEWRKRERCRSCRFILHKAYAPCSEMVRTWWSCCFNKYCHLSLSGHTHFCLRGTERKDALASRLQKEHCCFLHMGKHKFRFFHWTKLFLLIWQTSLKWEIWELSFVCFLRSIFHWPLFSL